MAAHTIKVIPTDFVPVPRAWSLLEQIERHEGLITVAEAAKMRGVHPATIRRAMKRGDIPPLNDGIGAEAIDPRAWAHRLRKLNPMMREAARG